MLVVERQDDHGRVIAHYMDPGVVSELLDEADPNGCRLAFIDPYGHTTFNQLQLPVLMEEIRQVQKKFRRASSMTASRITYSS
jgi:hypothetical protein